MVMLANRTLAIMRKGHRPSAGSSRPQRFAGHLKSDTAREPKFLWEHIRRENCFSISGNGLGKFLIGFGQARFRKNNIEHNELCFLFGEPMPPEASAAFLDDGYTFNLAA